MSKLIAIDWDAREVRAVVANGRPDGKLAVEHVIAAELEGEQPQQTGARLAEALAAAHASKGSALVVAGRSSVELNVLQLPPAPEDELAEMVRFQAQREFTSLDDEASLDFLPLAGDATESHRVLAAVAPASVLDAATTVCEQVDRRPSRIGLRACATTSLLQQGGMLKPDEPVLVVNRVGQEVDLTVAIEGRVELLRTVRASEKAASDELCNVLVGEIRRTVASARNQLEFAPITTVLISGDPIRDSDLADQLGQRLDIQTQVFNPFDLVTSGQAHGVDESEPGKYASLLGMLSDEAAGRRPAFDFLHPRQKPRAETRRPTYVLAAAVVVLAALWYGWSWYRELAVLDRDIEDARQQIDSHHNLATFEDARDKADQIGSWLSGGFSWLEELQRVSLAMRPKLLKDEEFPVSDDSLATGLRFALGAGGGQIHLDAASRGRAVQRQLEERLRGDRYDVGSVGGDDETARPGYGWKFTTVINVERNRTTD